MRGEADAVRREKLIAALRAGRNISQAARESGYLRTNIYKMARGDETIGALVRESSARGRRRSSAPTAAPRPRPKAEQPKATTPEQPAEQVGEPAVGVEALLQLERLGIHTLTRVANDKKAADSACVAAARALLRYVRDARFACLDRERERETDAGPAPIRLLDPIEAAKRLAL